MTNVEQLAAVVDAGKLSGRDRDFALSLLGAAQRRGLTPKQEPWVTTLLERANGKAIPQKSEELGPVAAIFALFARAKASKLKFPKIRLQTIDGQRIVFSQAGARSQYAGQVQITDGQRYPDNLYFGRIDERGNLFPTRVMTDDVRAVVDAFAADPASVAAQYGRTTGACCFCGLDLSDEKSTAVGYGPVCAKKFGLAWGGGK